jgi:hypothetical protein
MRAGGFPMGAAYYPPPPPPPRARLPAATVLIAIIASLAVGFAAGYFSSLQQAPSSTVTGTVQVTKTVTVTGVGGESVSPEVDVIIKRGERFVGGNRFELVFKGLEKPRYIEVDDGVWKARDGREFIIAWFSFRNVANSEKAPLDSVDFMDMIVVSRKYGAFKSSIFDRELVESVNDEVRKQAVKVNLDYGDEIAPGEEKVFAVLFSVPEDFEPYVIVFEFMREELRFEQGAVILAGS